MYIRQWLMLEGVYWEKDGHPKGQRSLGRANTNGVQCHARSRFDGVHAGVRQYPQGAAAPNFCVRCLTRGSGSRR